MACMYFPRFTWPDASVGTWTAARAIKTHCWKEWRVTLPTSRKPGMPQELSRFRTLLDKTRCMRTGAQKAQVCYIAILRRNEMPKLHSGAAFCIRHLQLLMFFVVSGLATFPSTSRPLSSIFSDCVARGTLHSLFSDQDAFRNDPSFSEAIRRGFRNVFRLT